MYVHIYIYHISLYIYIYISALCVICFMRTLLFIVEFSGWPLLSGKLQQNPNLTICQATVHHGAIAACRFATTVCRDGKGGKQKAARTESWASGRERKPFWMYHGHTWCDLDAIYAANDFSCDSFLECECVSHSKPFWCLAGLHI